MRINIALISTLFVFNLLFGSVDKIDTLKISESCIIVNQHTVLSFPLTVETLKSIHGTSCKSNTKSESEQNAIYFWDKSGVIVYNPKNKRNNSLF